MGITPIHPYMWVKIINLLVTLAFPLTAVGVVNVPKDVYFGV
jgi:hypothetical protein